MPMSARQALKSVVERLGVSVTSSEYIARLRQDRSAHAGVSERLRAYLEFIAAAPAEKAKALAAAAVNAESQLGQELFVLSELGLKRGGYFVEFGATNGVSLSNSVLLEREFGWSGILAEPAKCWHRELRANRASIVETECVWSKTGDVVQFTEATEAEYSTVGAFKDGGSHLGSRNAASVYVVPTVSLNDLLDRHGAPREIDYLSIDTEGSELDILRAFDFDKRSFRVITCEHNFTPAREEIFSLLSSKGYVRRFPELSKWDDWFARP